MARKTRTYTVPGEADDANRDGGKSFIITEMPAAQAEKWAWRAILAMSKNGVQLPEGYAEMGLAIIAHMSLSAMGSAGWQDVEPLLDELMQCVTMDQGAGPVSWQFVETQIEEPKTIALLRDEVVALHANFSLTEILSNFVGLIKGAIFSHTPMSPSSLAE